MVPPDRQPLAGTTVEHADVHQRAGGGVAVWAAAQPVTNRERQTGFFAIISLQVR